MGVVWIVCEILQAPVKRGSVGGVGGVGGVRVLECVRVYVLYAGVRGGVGSTQVATKKKKTFFARINFDPTL